MPIGQWVKCIFQKVSLCLLIQLGHEAQIGNKFGQWLGAEQTTTIVNQK